MYFDGISLARAIESFAFKILIPSALALFASISKIMGFLVLKLATSRLFSMVVER